MFYDEEYENEGKKCSVDTMEQDATAAMWRLIAVVLIIIAGLTWIS